MIMIYARYLAIFVALILFAIYLIFWPLDNYQTNQKQIELATSSSVSSHIHLPSTSSVTKIKPGDSQPFSSRASWREYYDKEMEFHQNNYVAFLNEISLKNNDLALVINDYVDVMRNFCGYDISETGLSTILQQSQMFSFLLAIKLSSSDNGSTFYENVVKAAHNAVDCGDEGKWISNTRALL